MEEEILVRNWRNAVPCFPRDVTPLEERNSLSIKSLCCDVNLSALASSVKSEATYFESCKGSPKPFTPLPSNNACSLVDSRSTLKNNGLTQGRSWNNKESYLCNGDVESVTPRILTDRTSTVELNDDTENGNVKIENTSLKVDREGSKDVSRGLGSNIGSHPGISPTLSCSATCETKSALVDCSMILPLPISTAGEWMIHGDQLSLQDRRSESPILQVTTMSCAHLQSLSCCDGQSDCDLPLKHELMGKAELPASMKNSSQHSDSSQRTDSQTACPEEVFLVEEPSLACFSGNLEKSINGKAGEKSDGRRKSEISSPKHRHALPLKRLVIPTCNVVEEQPLKDSPVAFKYYTLPQKTNLKEFADKSSAHLEVFQNRNKAKKKSVDPLMNHDIELISTWCGLNATTKNGFPLPKMVALTRAQLDSNGESLVVQRKSENDVLQSYLNQYSRFVETRMREKNAFEHYMRKDQRYEKTTTGVPPHPSPNASIRPKRGFVRHSLEKMQSSGKRKKITGPMRSHLIEENSVCYGKYSISNFNYSGIMMAYRSVAGVA